MKRSHWITIPVFSILLTTMVACNEKTEPEKKEASTEAKVEINEAAAPKAEVKEVTAPKTKADYEKKLVGKWKLDGEVLKTALEAGIAEAQKEIDPEDPMAAMMATMMDEMMSAMMEMEMSVDFSADGTCTMTTSVMGEESTEEGKWEITKVDGSMLTVVVDEDPGIINYLSDDIIEMVLSEEEAAEAPPGMEKMILNRVK